MESLCLGTPVIVTDCSVFKEIGVVDGKNGFVLNFDLSNIQIEKIYKGLPKFEYRPKKDKWGDVLAKGENQYKIDMNTPAKVRCTRKYHDLQLGRMIEKGEVITVSKVRAETIIEHGFGELV